MMINKRLLLFVAAVGFVSVPGCAGSVAGPAPPRSSALGGDAASSGLPPSHRNRSKRGRGLGGGMDHLLKPALGLKGGAEGVVAAVKNKPILWGNIGNLLTAALSFWLLYITPFDVDATSEGCRVTTNDATCSPPGYTGPLDNCYVCDGFCISNPVSTWINSHMLSLYADLLFTVPLLLFRVWKKDELVQLGLDDFFVSQMKAVSVAGHGVAHFFLSILTIGFPELNKNTRLVENAVGGALAVTRFGNPSFMRKTKYQVLKFLGVVDEKDRSSIVLPGDDDDKASRKTVARSTVAPVLAHTILAQQTASPTQEVTWVNYAVFGLACFIFFEAGVPSGENSTLFAIAMAAVAAYIGTSVLNIQTPQQSFVLVFTSAYLVSAFYQLFFWDEKEDNAVPYAVSALTSNLLTTLVGWWLASRCTSVKGIGGHVWYDISIPVSYFLIYFVCKKLAPY